MKNKSPPVRRRILIVVLLAALIFNVGWYAYSGELEPLSNILFGLAALMTA